MISSQLACQLSQLRALLWYHRGHGFKSHTSQNLFRPNFYYCSLSSVHYCEGHFHIHFFIQSSDNYMIFKYSQSLIHQFPGLLGNKRNDQLPVGLLAQLVEHCTRLVLQRPRIQIPYRPEFFSGLIFTSALEVFITANIAFIFKIIFIFTAKTI